MPDSHSDASPRLPASVEVMPGDPVVGVIRPPGSKSLTNRALICAAFADGRSTLRGTLQSEDTKVMIDALRSIGVGVTVSDGGKMVVVDGQVSEPRSDGVADQGSGLQDLYVANSGTTVRFLAAALSAFGGRFRLSGVERMHQRPIGDLVAALEMVVDGSVEAVSPEGCPPVDIRWSRLERSKDPGGRIGEQSVFERLDDGGPACQWN